MSIRGPAVVETLHRIVGKREKVSCGVTVTSDWTVNGASSRCERAVCARPLSIISRDVTCAPVRLSLFSLCLVVITTMLLRTLLLMVLKVSGYHLMPHVMPRGHMSFAMMGTADAAEPSSMKMKELKAELDEKGVTWRGVAFEKDELVRLLEDARTRPPSPPPPPPASDADAPPAPSPAEAAKPDASTADDEAAYQAAYKTA